MNDFKINYKTALDRIEPDKSLNEKIFDKSEKAGGHTRYIKTISAIAVLSVIAFSVVVSAMYIYNSIGGFEKFFGTAENYKIDNPTVISSSSNGDDVIFNFTGSWCDGVNLYISGTIVTPEPLNPDIIYCIIPNIKLSGGEKDILVYSKLYLTGENTAEFLIPVANYWSKFREAENIESGSVTIDIQIKWIEYIPENRPSEFNAKDFAIYSGEWLTTLSIPINSRGDYDVVINGPHIFDFSGEYSYFIGEDRRPLQDNAEPIYYKYTPLIINSVKLNPFTLIIESESFVYTFEQTGYEEYPQTDWYGFYIKMEDGTLMEIIPFGVSSLNDWYNEDVNVSQTENKITVAFSKPLDLSKVVSLVIVDSQWPFGKMNAVFQPPEGEPKQFYVELPYEQFEIPLR